MDAPNQQTPSFQRHSTKVEGKGGFFNPTYSNSWQKVWKTVKNNWMKLKRNVGLMMVDSWVSSSETEKNTPWLHRGQLPKEWPVESNRWGCGPTASRHIAFLGLGCWQGNHWKNMAPLKTWLPLNFPFNLSIGNLQHCENLQIDIIDSQANTLCALFFWMNGGKR